MACTPPAPCSTTHDSIPSPLSPGQVAYCDTLLPPLRRAARQAMAAMDRKPISDLVA